jgi:hypothetical protein
MSGVISAVGIYSSAIRFDPYLSEVVLNVDMLGTLVVFWLFGEGNRPLIVSIELCGWEIARFFRIGEVLLDFSKELTKPDSFFGFKCGQYILGFC